MTNPPSQTPDTAPTLADLTAEWLADYRAMIRGRAPGMVELVLMAAQAAELIARHAPGTYLPPPGAYAFAPPQLPRQDRRDPYAGQGPF